MAEPLSHPGLEGVVAGETAVSTLAHGLFYRGYAVEELAQHATFEEAAYLILYGELPTADQLTAFNQRLRHNAPAPLAAIDILRRLPPGADMMDVMRTGASLLAHWDPDQKSNDRDANFRKAERLLAQMPVILAARHRLLQGKEPVSPDRHYSLAENLLRMLRRRDPSPSRCSRFGSLPHYVCRAGIQCLHVCKSGCGLHAFRFTLRSDRSHWRPERAIARRR